MKTINFCRFLSVLVLNILLTILCVQAQHGPADLSIYWQTDAAYDGKNQLRYQLVLKNDGRKAFSLNEWDLFFNTMFPILDEQTEKYAIKDLKGNVFQITFSGQTLQPKDSLVISYTSKYIIPGVSMLPNGFYLLNNKDKKTFFGIEKVSYKMLQRSAEENRSYLAELYNKNKAFEKAESNILIFPTPKYLKESKGKYRIKHKITVQADTSLYPMVSREVSSIVSVEFTNGGSADLVLKQNPSLGAEAYHLTISENQISIEASQYAGFLYAIKSIKSLYSGVKHTSGEKVLPCIEVKDEPRYGYRGFMMDIARNFRDKSIVLKYLDLMADYKLNVLHFHFIEDEAWRIEIPGLPELTEVGARRSPLFHEGNALMPAYGSAADTQARYLTRADFIEILRYAQERNIQVVPEIETPGHARAAIKAMWARYNRFMRQGKPELAEQYLLHDPEDKSVYNTPQNYNDNVLNPALPSVYTFIEKVLDEFALMYKEAGVPFTKVSLGGDEVPRGVWEGSPKIKAFMEEQGMSSVHEVWTYYIDRINKICLKKGLQLAGWEEIGMVNKGKGMVVNPNMADKQNMQLDVWNNVIGGGQEDLVYRLANAGYPTVLISASNTYFDMMWDRSFDEPGLNWATYADLYHSYSLFPEDYFANIHTYYSGKKLDRSRISQLERINEKGRAHFLGIKGGVFAETLLKDENLDYLAFPRFYVLAERAWAQRKPYESEKTFDISKFDKDYASFIDRIGRVELQEIQDRVAFRLPKVGLKQEGKIVLFAAEYPGFDVYYTLDGSLPTQTSSKADKATGIRVERGQKLTIAVLDKNGRRGPVSTLDIE